MTTYADSGVDIRKEAEAVDSIVKTLESTFSSRKGKTGEVLNLGGHFANLIDIGGGKALAMCTDGVGSKVLIAQLLEKYDTIGIDMVAMVANDLICIGAEPLALVDYYAVEKTNEKIAAEIARGIAEGAKQAEMAVIGGETATLPNIICGAKPGAGFDLAATAVGILDKNSVITGEKIAEGDAIIGLASSGIHSNGLSLARQVLDLSDKEILSTLLTPTKIYVKEILSTIQSCTIHGLANITGSGLLNIGRLKQDVKIDIDSPPPLPAIFSKIQQAAKISDAELYRTFNCGIGFAIVAPESEIGKIKKICSLLSPQVIGRISSGSGVCLRGEKL